MSDRSQLGYQQRSAKPIHCRKNSIGVLIAKISCTELRPCTISVGFTSTEIRHFVSWREAIAEAGINLANVTRHKPKNLDRDAMLLWVRNRKEAGQPITFFEVCLENRDFALAIKREFRTWSRALKAAFPPQESSVQERRR